MISLELQEDLSLRHHQPFDQECRGRDLEDQISELPEDILIRILSNLTMKEAGKTSVLSKRWRHVWAYIPVLNFDSSKIWKDLEEEVTSLDKEEPKFVRWVDQVVSSHKAATIDEFKIHFDLQKNRKDNVYNWIRYAIEKRVKRLHLGIKHWICYRRPFITFPSFLLCNSLTSLRLAGVDVTGEVMEKLLHDCKSLELVSVESSDTLVDLNVAGSSLNLKSLSIKSCCMLKVMQICAPKLISFNYSGPILSSPLRTCPKLTKISMGGGFGFNWIHQFCVNISSCSSYIEELSLDCSMPTIKCIQPQSFPVWPRLKTLDVVINPVSDEELFGVPSLIKACPLLEKFVLRFDPMGPQVVNRFETSNMEACRHDHCLKILEIVEFNGSESQLGLVKYLIENAVSMEKITIQLISQRRSYMKLSLEETRSIAKQQAEQLHSTLKPGTGFQILEDHPPLSLGWWNEEESLFF